ncbi:MAG: PAS domain S-box protein [Chitinophagaceae bacterium]|nr:MAG: PAS domain S-box protein [Chitinophagaceae bacterium]
MGINNCRWCTFPLLQCFTMKSPQTSTNELLAVPRENYFQWMMDNIDEAFVLLDKEFRIVESNRAAREGLWGKAGFELYPGFSVLDAVEEDRVPLLRHLFAEVLTGCRRKTEYALTQPDGVTLHIENNLLPARNSQNEVVGIIVHSKNITEEKNSQRNVQQATWKNIWNPKTLCTKQLTASS